MLPVWQGGVALRTRRSRPAPAQPRHGAAMVGEAAGERGAAQVMADLRKKKTITEDPFPRRTSPIEKRNTCRRLRPRVSGTAPKTNRPPSSVTIAYTANTPASVND